MSLLVDANDVNVTVLNGIPVNVSDQSEPSYEPCIPHDDTADTT